MKFGNDHLRTCFRYSIEIHIFHQIKDNRLQFYELGVLTLPVPIPDEEKKISSTFIFTLLCGISKCFMKALKAFIKHFEVPQRSIKNKNLTYFFISIQPSEMQGTWSIDEVMAK